MKPALRRGALSLSYAVLVLVWGLVWVSACDDRADFPWCHAHVALLSVVSVATLGLLLRRTDRLRILFEALALLVLPAWGYEENGVISSDPCNDASHLFAIPEIDGVYVAYAVSVGAYIASRVRPEGYPRVAESFVNGLLLFGLVLVGALAVHSVVELPLGMIYFGAGLPLLAPWAVASLYSVVLWQRRGIIVAWGSSLAVAAASLGLYAIANAVVEEDGGRRGSADEDVWGPVLSHPPRPRLQRALPLHRGRAGNTAPRRPPEAWAPEGRVDRRESPARGANAFEDLLHERWPRAARRIRNAYDRIGFPVSRFVRRRWAADVTFLMMKPTEWLFLGFLRSFDPDAEARIDRMYR